MDHPKISTNLASTAEDFTRDAGRFAGKVAVMTGAACAAYLPSDDAAFLTGVRLDMDGGRSIG